MSVKQFNGRYLLNDDRIIFRFNTVDHSEYIFWLTRKITHYILTSTSQFIENEYQQHTHSVEKVISETQQPEKQATSFAKPYVPGETYPLGGEAVLVIDAKCRMIKIEEHDVFSLDLMLPAGTNLNIKLPVPVMKALILLLEDLNVQAKWGNPVGKFH